MNDAPGQKTEGVAVNLKQAGTCSEVTEAPRQDVGTQLRRRRQASYRLEPLPCGRRDPWSRPAGRHRDVDRLDAWVWALAHLRDAGLVGLPPAHVRRALADRRAVYNDSCRELEFREDQAARRRRREAARRLPPLADGRRDPAYDEPKWPA